MPDRYRTIAQALQEEIDSGQYTPGDLLPSHTELSIRFRAAGMTIRRAISVLESDGLVRVVRGVGTEVLDQRAVVVKLSAFADVIRADAERGPWETACARAGLNGAVLLLRVQPEPAPPDVADLLAVEAGAPLIRRDRHATIDGTVVQIQTARSPLALIEGTPLAQLVDIPNGVYAAMAAAGLHPATADWLPSARGATLDEARVLGLRENAPVATIERRTYDRADRPIELLRVVSNPRRATIVLDRVPLG